MKVPDLLGVEPVDAVWVWVGVLEAVWEELDVCVLDRVLEAVVEAVCEFVFELVTVREGDPVRVFVMVMVLEGVVEGVLGREAVLELVIVWL